MSVRRDRRRRKLDEDVLSGYLDGELDPADRVAVEDRLKGDSGWRLVLEEVRLARDAVRAMPTLDLPAEVVARVSRIDDVDDRSADVVSISARRATRRARFVAAAAAAAAAALPVALVPSAERVRPDVAALSDAHAIQSSVTDDPISALAPFGVSATNLGR